MVKTTHILQRPAQFQFDTDSAPCKSTNCGPTCYAMIVGYYKDTHISPAAMRRAMGLSTCGGTNPTQGSRGMNKLGVRAGYGILTPTQVKTKVKANIPVAISVIYKYIPKSLRQDDNFTGSHVVLICKIVTQNGVPGALVRDPLRWGTGKVPYVFWPDRVWIPAFNATKNSGAFPLAPKR